MEVVKSEENKLIEKKEEKLWNMNFALLWQGQLVSAMGDIIYEIALGFWVLARTGSTGLMGTLMAASMLPRVIISPFAGVIVDRADRKKLLVWMDFIRGVMITFVGIAALLDFIQIWMVFVAGVLLGVCGAFFNPSVSSSIPDIVPKSKLIKANSALSMVQNGINVIANPIGGFLYVVLGAPLMFLFNGISYLFSSFTEIFIKIPKVERPVQEKHFIADLTDGFKFVWNFKGLRYIVSMAAFINFFAMMAIVLVLPLFQRTAGLGEIKYGWAIATMTGGMFLGALVTSIINIQYEKRMKLFCFSGILFTILFSIVPLVSFGIMLPLLLGAGFFNSIVNTFIGASVQITVPQEMRGKVFALMGTVSGGLAPLGMAIGGILGEFIPIPYLMSGSFLITLIPFIPLIFSSDFKKFINFNPETQTLEDII